MSKMSGAAAPTPPAPYGGYALTKVHRAGGDETTRFDSVLVLDGRPVAYVSNGGEGGAHRWSPVAPDGWAAIEEFHRYATEWNVGTEFAGIEDGGQLVNRLLMVDKFNRMRNTPFVLDADDPWADGVDICYLRGASRGETISLLRSGSYVHRSPRIWDKGVSDLVPVD